MNTRHVIGGGLLLAAGLLAGCATGASDTAATACGADYHCARDLMFQYRQQARELSMIAERYAREADIKARELGQDSEQVRSSQEMARKFWLQAQEADELAHEYQNQLPHNVY